MCKVCRCSVIVVSELEAALFLVQWWPTFGANCMHAGNTAPNRKCTCSSAKVVLRTYLYIRIIVQQYNIAKTQIPMFQILILIRWCSNFTHLKQRTNRAGTAGSESREGKGAPYKSNGVAKRRSAMQWGCYVRNWDYLLRAGIDRCPSHFELIAYKYIILGTYNNVLIAK